MNKSILTMAVLALMAGTTSISYGQNPEKKPVTASENIQKVPNEKVDAKQDLKGAKKDVSSDDQNFRKESESIIKNTNNRIDDLKVFFYQNKVKDKEAFQNNLNLLEQKCDNQKKLLAEYLSGQNKLASFKPDFKNEMDEIGKSLKNFVNNNK
jgi:hypothetical protein